MNIDAQRHYVILLYLAVVIAAHALALLVCSMCSPLMAVGILLNLRVNAVFPLYWRGGSGSLTPRIP